MTIVAPSSRNALCPCGSQRRYKDCHGAITSARDAAIASPPERTPGPAQSMYRPAGLDWDHLSEIERDACGALMQRALKKQQAGKLTEAAAFYGQVLSLAPKTHDALHMLGAIELRRGNLAEAKRLIVEALELRPPYPDIEHNLRMVQDLERAARVEAGRPSAPPEALCEKALPYLVDLALRPSASRAPTRSAGRTQHTERHLHLIGGVCESNDDDAWLLRRLAALLAPERPTLWVDARQRVFASPVRRLAGEAGEVPRGGCHVFVGIDIDCAAWIERADAERVVVFCQPGAPSRFLQQLRVIARDGARPLELVFPSQAMAARFGAGHAVLPPPIAIDFGETWADACLGDRPFAAGLHGTYWQNTSPSEDAVFLKRLAATAGTLHLYDPGPLRYSIGADPAIHCWVRSATARRRLLRTVDCLLHVPGKWWLEGDGRELFMAMAAGVPIICPRSSLFAEYVAHDVDGLLYDERDEALEHIAALRRNPVLRAALARSARQKIAGLVAPEHVLQETRRIVLGEEPAGLQGGVVERERVAAK